MPAANRSGVGAKRDAGWLAVIMVYVLARIVGQVEPTHMLSYAGAGDAARRDLLVHAMSTFSREVASPERVSIYLQNGGHADLDATVDGTVLYFAFDGEPWREPAQAAPPATSQAPPSPPQPSESVEAPQSSLRQSAPVAAPPLPMAVWVCRDPSLCGTLARHEMDWTGGV